MNSDVRGSTRNVHPSDRKTPSRAAALIAPLIVASGIAYGSLLPFEWRQDTGAWWSLNPTSLAWPAPVTLEDLITNVLVYIPLGFVAFFAIRWRPATALEWDVGNSRTNDLSPAIGSPRREPGIVCVVGLSGLLLSIALECLQANLALRVASWVDVLLNTLGTLIGAAVAPIMAAVAKRGVSNGWDTLAQRPYSALSFLLVFAWLASWLAPIDFVSNTAELWNAFHSMGQLAPGERAWESIAPASGTGWIALRHTVLLVLLGCILRLAAGEWDRDRGRALVTAFTHAMALLVIGGLLQFLNTSHNVNAVSLLMGVPAISLGMLLGHNAVDSGRAGLWPSSRPIGLYTVALLVAIMLSNLALDELRSGSSGTMRAWPFVDLWKGAMTIAAGKILLVCCATIALTLLVLPLCRMIDQRRPGMIAGVVMALFAILHESSRPESEVAALDLSGPLLVVMTAVLVIHAARWAGPYTSEMQPVASSQSQLP